MNPQKTRPDTRQKMRLVCVLFTFEDNWGRTDGGTYGWTGTPSYRDATAHLKTLGHQTSSKKVEWLIDLHCTQFDCKGTIHRVSPVTVVQMTPFPARPFIIGSVNRDTRHHWPPTTFLTSVDLWEKTLEAVFPWTWNSRDPTDGEIWKHFEKIRGRGVFYK